MALGYTVSAKKQSDTYEVFMFTENRFNYWKFHNLMGQPTLN